MITEKAERLKKLRKEILDLQGFRALPGQEHAISLGAMNGAFPNGVFPVSAVHEFISNTGEEAAATGGFMAALLGSLMHQGYCLWVSARRLVFPPALKAFGMEPDRVIFTDVPNERERLWTIEEGLKCAALAAVVGEVGALSFTASRRLQLAVEKSRVTGFIHRHSSAGLNNVACVSRWNVKPLGSASGEMPGMGFPRWEVALLKIRSGKPGRWNVIWTDEGFAVSDLRAETMVVPMKKTG